MAQELIDRLFAIPSPEEALLAPLMEPQAPMGTGSATLDEYIARRVAMLDDTPNNYSDKYGLSMEAIKGMGGSDVADFVRARIAASSDRTRQNIVEAYARMYGQTQDPVYLQKAQERVINADPNGKQLKQALPQAVYDRLANTKGEYDKSRVTRDIMYEDFWDFLNSTGEWDTLGDKVSAIAGLLIPFRNTWQFGRKGAEGFGLRPIKGFKEYTDQLANLRALGDEERIAEFRKLLPEIWKEAGENPVIFTERATPYIDKDDINNVYLSLGFDVAEGLPLIARSVGKTYRFVKGQRTPIKIARNAGNKKVAAELTKEVLQDQTGKAEEAIGVTKSEAAWNLSPFQAEGLDPLITNGIAAESQKAILEGLKEVNKPLDQLFDPNFFVQRSALDQAEQLKKQSAYMEQFAGKAEITKTQTDGFWVKVQIENPDLAKYDELQGSLVGKIDNLNAERETILDRLEDLQSWNKTKFPENAPLSAARSNEEIASLGDRLMQVNKEIAENTKQFRGLGEKPSATIIDEQFIPYRRNDVGELEATYYENASRFINAPKFYINQMKKGVVEDATLPMLEMHRLAAALEKSATAAYGKLGIKQKKNVGALWEAGDDAGVDRYSVADMMHGIDTPHGIVKIDTVEEAVAYYAGRNHYDTLHMLKNSDIRKRLVFEGYDKSAKVMVGKAIDGLEEVDVFLKPNAGHIPSEVKRIYSTLDKRVVDVDSATMNELIDKHGYVVGKSKHTLEIGDERINYVLTKQADLNDLPEQVLRRRPGYVPRMYKNIFFVAERVGDALVDGVKSPVRSVARYFDNLDEAERWRDASIAKGEQITIRPGKEYLDFNPGAKDEFEETIFGGIYSGKRADQEVPFGIKGTKAERVSAWKALEAYMGHVASQIPLSEFRMGMVQRFLNSVESLEGALKTPVLATRNDWKSQILIPPTSKDYAGLKAMQDWMKDVLYVRSKEERAWSYTMSKIGNLMEGNRLVGKVVPGSGKLREISYNMASKDMSSALRTASFHFMLGFFNPVQIIVQGMGAAMAWSLAPQKIHRLMPQYAALRFALNHLDNPELVRHTAWSAGLNGEEFSELVRAFDRSGLKQAVRSSADFNAALSGFSVGSGALRRVADKTLVFFREGETFVRGYAWLLARDEFLSKLEKGVRKGYKFTDQDIDTITKRSLDFTLNLNRANRAYWQKGLLSIPTQFWQILTKFYENIGYGVKKGGWTKSEKARILAGHAFMFGAAGVPAGEWFSNNFLQWAKSDEDFGLGIKDEEMIRTISGGALEKFVRWSTGADVDLSSRVSIPEGVSQLLETWLDTDKDLGTKLMGAFGQLPNRLYQMVDTLKPVFAPSVIPYWDLQTVGDIADEVAKITSTWRNLHKAKMYVNTGHFVTSKGKELASIEETNYGWRQVAFQAFGLTPNAVKDYWEGKEWLKEVEQDVVDVVDAWSSVAVNFTHSGLAGNKNYDERIKRMMEVLASGLTDDQKAQAAKMMAERLKDNKHALTKLLIDGLEALNKSEGNTVPGDFGRKGIELNPLFGDRPKKEVE